MTLISNYPDAVAILRDRKFSSSRHAAVFARLRARTGAVLADTENFFKEWLMYMDGLAHQTVRAVVVSTLKRCEEGSFNSRRDVENAIAVGRVDGAWIENVVSRWHAEMFGMTPGQQAEMFELCDPLLRFLLHRETDRLAILDQRVRDLLSWMTKQQFEEGKAISNLMRKKVPLGTIVNLVIDSYEPVKVGLANIFYIAGRVDPTIYPPRTFVMECLRLLPPFRFINRLDTESCPVGEKVSIDLMQCNRDTSAFQEPELIAKRGVQSLTFGKGAHSCPGFSLTSLFLCAIWTDFCVSFASKGLRVSSEGREDNDKGLCRILDLSVRFKA
ncbi:MULTISPECIES: hypothetical protein [Rhizobium]|uniref:hypothetical protein n=1 Tax=Rhizobium TaxID=379 RepID=UPI001C830A4E|nr:MULTISPECIES: hypothetical protein [Rhizobium]MBX4893754.1 hypothetical protein [Rhizobium bangladeshense]MBX5014404.1 hypothetical protein [Rhizobium lentis]